MSTSTRLLKYVVPYSGSIIVAILCALVIALCETGYVGVLAETIDAMKVIENNGLPTTVVFPSRSNISSSDTDQDEDSPLPKRIFGSWTVHLQNTKDAIRLISIISLIVLGLFVTKGILFFGNTYIMSRVGQKLTLSLRNELYGRLVHFPLGVFTQRRAGDIMSRGTNDMSMLLNSVQSMASFITAMSTVMVVMVIMFVKSWQLTLLTIIIFPPAMYVINRFGKRLRKASTRIQIKVADISSYLERTVSGIKIIKSFATEDWEKERFTRESKAQYSVVMRRVRLSAYLTPIMELITAVGMVVVFWLGFWQVITGKLTTGWFMGFIGLVGMVYKPVKTLGTLNASLQQALASAERIFEMMDEEPEVQDAPGAISIPRIKGDVEFRDVSFAYDGQKSVLSHVSLSAHAGESVALVGPSGAGKTTLVNLLARFYEIADGEIFIDGYRISEVSLRSLRKQIGLVPQETVIFGGTVRENIAYGRFGATEEEIMEAAKKANAHEFIEQLANGYDTPIGERGMQISGGQRQRLAIARAILKNPRILILDEATSSLDTESEALIQEAMSNLMQDKTTFIIAHRLSTVMNADRILVLDKGEIVESGTHAELFAQKGLYRRLCNAQFRTVISDQ